MDWPCLPTQLPMFSGAFKGPWRFKHKKTGYSIYGPKEAFLDVDCAIKNFVGQEDSQVQNWL